LLNKSRKRNQLYLHSNNTSYVTRSLLDYQLYVKFTSKGFLSRNDNFFRLVPRKVQTMAQISAHVPPVDGVMRNRIEFTKCRTYNVIAHNGSDN